MGQHIQHVSQMGGGGHMVEWEKNSNIVVNCFYMGFNTDAATEAGEQLVSFDEKTQGQKFLKEMPL